MFSQLNSHPTSSESSSSSSMVSSSSSPSSSSSSSSLTCEGHEKFLRRAIQLSIDAKNQGNHPFGAVIVHKGQIILEAQNSVVKDNDATRHAEMNLVSKACQKFSQQVLKECVLYTSCEPCIMCSGAIFWVGIETIVFAMREFMLDKITRECGFQEQFGTLHIPCRDVFKHVKGKDINILGPLLEDEASKVHESYWDKVFGHC